MGWWIWDEGSEISEGSECNEGLYLACLIVDVLWEGGRLG